MTATTEVPALEITFRARVDAGIELPWEYHNPYRDRPMCRRTGTVFVSLDCLERLAEYRSGVEVAGHPEIGTYIDLPPWADTALEAIGFAGRTASHATYGTDALRSWLARERYFERPTALVLNEYELRQVRQAINPYARKLERAAEKSTFVPEPGHRDVSAAKARQARSAAEKVQAACDAVREGRDG